MKVPKTQDDQISNKENALDLIQKFSRWPRSSWVTKGSRAKANEAIEIPRVLAEELADKALQYYLVLEQLPYNPFCDCKHIEGLIQKALSELPAGDTADEFEQIMLDYCPNCGKRFND